MEPDIDLVPLPVSSSAIHIGQARQESPRILSGEHVTIDAIELEVSMPKLVDSSRLHPIHSVFVARFKSLWRCCVPALCGIG
jgi:hypothetical protein